MKYFFSLLIIMDRDTDEEVFETIMLIQILIDNIDNEIEERTPAWLHVRSALLTYLNYLESIF